MALRYCQRVLMSRCVRYFSFIFFTLQLPKNSPLIFSTSLESAKYTLVAAAFCKSHINGHHKNAKIFKVKFLDETCPSLESYIVAPGSSVLKVTFARAFIESLESRVAFFIESCESCEKISANFCITQYSYRFESL